MRTCKPRRARSMASAVPEGPAPEIENVHCAHAAAPSKAVMSASAPEAQGRHSSVVASQIGLVAMHEVLVHGRQTHEVLACEQPLRRLGDAVQDLVRRHPPRAVEADAALARVGHEVDLDVADVGTREAEAQDVANLVIVHAAGHDGDERRVDAVLSSRSRQRSFVSRRRAPCSVTSAWRVEGVERQRDARARRASRHEGLFAREAKSVRADGQPVHAGGAGHLQQVDQVWVQGGLAAGEVEDVELATVSAPGGRARAGTRAPRSGARPRSCCGRSRWGSRGCKPS